jgi:hypothetical protein
VSEMKPEAGDPVLVAITVAAEDDALKSKSTVSLPVDAFSKRLDGMVTHMPSTRCLGSEHAQHLCRPCTSAAQPPIPSSQSTDTAVTAPSQQCTSKPF